MSATHKPAQHPLCTSFWKPASVSHWWVYYYIRWQSWSGWVGHMTIIVAAVGRNWKEHCQQGGSSLALVGGRPRSKVDWGRVWPDRSASTVATVFRLKLRIVWFGSRPGPAKRPHPVDLPVFVSLRATTAAAVGFQFVPKVMWLKKSW